MKQGLVPWVSVLTVSPKVKVRLPLANPFTVK